MGSIGENCCHYPFSYVEMKNVKVSTSFNFKSFQEPPPTLSASASAVAIFLARGSVGTISGYLFHYKARGRGSEERSADVLHVRPNGALRIPKQRIVRFTPAKCALLF